MESKRIATAWAAATGTALIGVLLASAGWAQSPAPSNVGFSRDAGAVVASYTEEFAELADPVPGPSVTVYGDGRVLVHYPVTMKRAGDYELQLGEGELEDLLHALGEKLVDFDPAAARSRRSAALAAMAAGPVGEISVSDEVATVISLRLERFEPTAGGGPRLNVDKRIRWTGLRGDAQRLPGVREIQDLEGARRQLGALRDRSDLVKVE